MEQSQLIELIQTLSAEEKKHLQQFANLTFFNPGKMKKQVVPLLHACLGYSLQYSENSLDKKAIYGTIFPKQNFKEGKLEKVMVEALKVVRSFLLVLNYFREENEFYQLLDFAEVVRIRGLGARRQQALSRLRKLQEQSIQKNRTHYLRQIHLESAIHFDASLDNQYKGNLNIPNLLDAISAFHSIRRIELLNRYLLQKKLTILPFSQIIEDNLSEKSVPSRFIEDSLSLKINCEIFSYLNRGFPSYDQAKVLFSLLVEREKEIDTETLQEFYTYLRNFCVLAISEDVESQQFYQLLHNLYTDNLQRGYLFFEGRLTAHRYLQVSDCAVTIKQFEWANEFIEKYKNLVIGENEKQDIYRFNRANYLFHLGLYEEALSFIPDTSPFVDYLIKAKRLELKVLYELQSDLFTYRLDAFKMFLSRTSKNLLSDYLRRSNIDFVNLLFQIAHSTPGDKARSERILKRIMEKSPLVEKLWLIAKSKALCS